MDNRLIINQPLQPVKKTSRQNSTDKSKNVDKASFKKILGEYLQKKSGVKFSKHAQNRMISRNIAVSDSDLNQLKSGVEKAKNKGSRDSLIMVNNVAYVVSVENKTVITAMDNESMKENVFTNIDSAVFM